MLTNDFPITDYYKDNFVDATTIKRSGQWWSAALLIKNPNSKKNFLNFYKWQKTAKGWKVRSRFKVSSKEDIKKIRDIFDEYLDKLD